MNEEIKKPVITSETQVRDAKGRILPGHTLNPYGNKGAQHFKTKWLKFITKIAEKNNTTPEEVDDELLQVAYDQMKKADFRYWKDIQDRVYGAARTNDNLTTAIQINLNTLKDDNL